MADRQIDPSRLQGEALQRWYLRSPEEIEQGRQAAAAQRHAAFFGDTQAWQGHEGALEPRAVRLTSTPSEDILWVANGRGGYRAVRPGSNDLQATLEPEHRVGYPDYLPRNAAAPEDGELLEIGNPHNPRLKKEYIARYGYWPKTEDGRDYDVSHRRAIADGGTNTLDNIEPMHPDAHKAKHINDGDAKRWGKRPSIARTFGGRVEPPAGAPRVRGIGGPNPLDLLGMMSGRIRTGSLLNFGSDLIGVASREDVAREKERKRWEIQRQLIPDCPPGSQCI